MTASSESRKSLNRLLSILVKESGVTMLGRGAHTLLQIATHILLARTLLVSDYGLFVLAWTIAQFLALFAQMGLDKGVIKFGVEALNEESGRLNAVAVQSLVMQIFLATGLGIGLYLGAETIAVSVFGKVELEQPLRLIAVMTPVIAGLHVVGAVTRISQRMHYSVICERLVQPGGQFLLSILFVPVLGLGVAGAILALGIAYALGFVVGIALSLKLFPLSLRDKLIDLPLAWRILRYSVPTSMAAVFAKTNSWVDRLLIGYFMVAASVGIYMAASRVAALFMIIASVFHGIFGVLAADLSAKRDRENLTGVYRANTKWGLYVALPLFLIILFHADTIMQVFGGVFSRGGGPLIILSLGQLVNIGTGSVGLVLMMGGQQNRWMYVTAGMFVVNVAGNIALIPIWGLWGAALATSVSVAAQFIIGVFMARHYLNVWPYDRRFIKGLVAAAVSCLVPVSILLLTDMRPLVELLVSAPLIILVYGVVLTMLGLDEDDLWVLTRVRSKLSIRNSTA